MPNISAPTASSTAEHVYDFAELLDHDIDADLARRDFTINAMAVHLGSGALLDPHGGQRDIERGVVRMVHAENFDDDPLRVLKGVRMAVKYDFTIEDGNAATRSASPRAADRRDGRRARDVRAVGDLFGRGASAKLWICCDARISRSR